MFERIEKEAEDVCLYKRIFLDYTYGIGKCYAIEIVDHYGNKTAVEGLRVIFTTYDAAESYARFYRDIYKDQYNFRVTGIKE